MHWSATRKAPRCSLLGIALLSAASFAAAETRSVSINHSQEAPGVRSPINISANDTLRIEIVGTDPNCYFYNLHEVTPEPGAKAIGSPSVVLIAIHDESVTQYVVDITKKASAPPTCNLPVGRWTIPVRPFWEFGFAAGFTGDGLTDPVYFLEPTTLPAAGGEPARSGFFVKRDRGAEDSFHLGAAGMIHLIPRWNIIGGIGPALSFGLSVDDNTNAKYLLGLSLRFGARFYLSGGWAFGSRRRRTSGPTFETANGATFTQDPNALGNLSRKSGSALFIGLSYTFLDVGLQRFRDAISPAPAPAQAQPAKPNEQTGSIPTIAEVIPAGQKVGEVVTISGDGFGEPSADAVVRFDQPGVTKEVKADAAGVTWTPKKVELKVPDGLTPGKASLTISLGFGKASKPYESFSVLPASP